nr:uncharacterized protein LOC105489346 isoform X1 [Macaca nemestrina]
MRDDEVTPKSGRDSEIHTRPQASYHHTELLVPRFPGWGKVSRGVGVCVCARIYARACVVHPFNERWVMGQPGSGARWRHEEREAYDSGFITTYTWIEVHEQKICSSGIPNAKLKSLQAEFGENK